MNMEKCPDKSGHGRPDGLPTGDGRPAGALLLGRDDVGELAHAAAVLEFDHAGHLREQGVVLAPTDVEAGLNLGAALAHDHAAAGYELAAEYLHAQSLGVGVATVFGTA